MNDAPITPDRSAEATSKPHGPWRRWALRVVLVLVLATAGNVGFVIARWYWPDWEKWKEPLGPATYTRVSRHDRHQGVWIWSIHEFRGKTDVESWVMFAEPSAVLGSFSEIVNSRSAAPLWSLIRDEDRLNLVEYERCYERAYGWPWRCMMARVSVYSAPQRPSDASSNAKPPERVVQQFGTKSAHRITDDAEVSLLAPTHIFWPGMLANTLVWSAIVLIPWELWQGVWWIRRRIRVRRGRCPQCRYDLRGLGAATPCPECGRRIMV